MYVTHDLRTQRSPLPPVAPKLPKATKPREERRFCPSMFCFTDEIVVRRISPQTEVWLLTDESVESTWLSMGQEPVCPHCGTVLR